MLGSLARDVVELLLQKGVDINRYDEDGKTPLFM
jgi:ankyrin repeat protein